MKVQLDLETNLLPFDTAFEKAEQTITQTRTSVNQLAKDTKTTFGQANSNAQQFAKSVHTGTDEVTKLDKAVKAAHNPTSIREMQKEVKRLTSEAIKAGEGTRKFTENLRAAGKLKDEIQDLNAAVRSVSGNLTENLGKALAETTSLGVKGYEGLIAAQSLFGVENKEVEKQILKLQAVQSLSRLINEFGGLKDKLTEIKLAFSPITNLYTRGNEALKNWGKTGIAGADGVTKSNKNLFATMKSGIGGLVTSGINGFKSLWATIAANPLGVVLVVIGGIIAAMVALKDKIKPIAALFEFLGNLVDALLLPLEKLGQAFGFVASEQEKAAKKTIELSKKQEEAVESFYDSEIALAEATHKRTAEMEKRKINDLQESVRSRMIALLFLKKENGKLTEEQLKEYEESQKRLVELTREATVALAKEQQERTDFLKERSDRIKDIRIAAIKDDETREKAALKKQFDDEIEAVVQRVMAVTDNEKQQFNAALPEVQALRAKFDREMNEISAKFAQKRLEKQKQENDKLLALQKDFWDAFASIRARVEQEQLNDLVGEARIQKERELALREIELLKDTLIKKGQAEEDYNAKIHNRKAQVFQLNIEQDAAFAELRRQVFQKETEDLIKLAVDRENKIAQARTAAAQQTETNLNSEEGNLISTVQLQGRPVDTSEQDFETAKQKAILDIQSEYALKRLELRKASLAAERAEQLKAFNGELQLLGERNDEEANIRRAQIMESVQILEQKFAAEGEKASDEFAKLINDIQDKRDELNKKPPFDLMKFLGITPESAQNLKTLFGEVIKGFEGLIDTQLQQVNNEIQESESRKSNAESQISTLENKLEAEKGLSDQGKANNQSAIAAQLELQRQALEKEKQLQQEAFEERKRLQKQKLELDTIAQGANLITASTQILATTAKDPISLGIALGTIAAMLTSFALLKIQAFKAVEQGTPAFAEGVIDLKGPGTEKSDSINARLSRGESVMTAKETREDKKLFLGIRNKDRKLMREGAFNFLRRNNLTDILSSMRGMNAHARGIPAPMSLPGDLPNNIALYRSEAAHSGTAANSVLKNDFTALQKEQRETNKRLDSLIAEQKKKSYLDQNGNLVIKKGSHTIIRKK